MNVARRLFPAALWLAALMTSQASLADAAEEPSLASAERAYHEVDFERAYELGRQALQRGHASRLESLRLYVLLGMSAAALGHDEDAQRYFAVALSIDPTRKLERNLSPKIRSPYLQAEAALALYKTPLALSASENLAAQRLAFALEDPQSLVAKLTISLRQLGTEAYRKVELSKQAENAVRIDKRWLESGFEYHARGLDSFGNTLIELGSSENPVTVAAKPGANAQFASQQNQASAARSTAGSTPWFAIALGTAGLAALGTGAYFQVRRESAAEKWNGPDCERADATRGEQCADVDADRRRFQTAAIVSYAAGGALVVTSLATWLIGNASGARSSSVGSVTIIPGGAYAAYATGF
ncbi:MAG: hypothetical protein ACOY0T_16870 [Myxococcota bacterium]